MTRGVVIMRYLPPFSAFMRREKISISLLSLSLRNMFIHLELNFQSLSYCFYYWAVSQEGSLLQDSIFLLQLSNAGHRIQFTSQQIVCGKAKFLTKTMQVFQASVKFLWCLNRRSTHRMGYSHLWFSRETTQLPVSVLVWNLKAGRKKWVAKKPIGVCL